MDYQLPFEARFMPPQTGPQAHPIARLRLFALLLIAFVLFSLMGPHPLTDETGVQLVRSSGDVLTQAGIVALCLLLLLASLDTRNLWANLAVPGTLLVLLGYCLLSVTWAIDPAIAIRRLGLTAITIWFLCRTVSVLGYRHTLYSLRIALVVLLVLNYLTVLLSSHGIHGMEADVEAAVVGSWRGILAHKNVTGPICAMTVLLFVFDPRDINPVLRPLVIVAAAAFLWFTQSKTSVSALAVALVVGVVLSRVTDLGRSFRVIVLVVILIGVIQALSILSGDFVAALDDPGSFTGRSQIWSVLVRYTQTHLWSGAGFGSFWQIGNKGPVWDYTNSWVAANAASGHNGYLDLLVTIGLPGLLLALVVLFLVPIAQVCMDDTMVRYERGLLLALLTFILVHNMAESQLMDRADFDQQVLVLVLAFIAAHRQAPSLVRGLLHRIRLMREEAAT